MLQSKYSVSATLFTSKGGKVEVRPLSTEVFVKLAPFFAPREDVVNADLVAYYIIAKG